MAAKTRNDVLRVNMDPALGDLALAEARDALASGEWGPARDVLAETRSAVDGPQWDRRSHRVRVLAEAVANSSWVERWQVLEPVNPDAALLRAQVETVRTLRAALTGGAGVPETAAEALDLCTHAAEMAPEDPTPWVIMLTLARAADRGRKSGREEFWQHWQQMRALDALNRDGHHEALIYLFDAWCGSHQEMYDFAYWLAGEAPPGSPLAALPLVAHAEVFRTANVGVPRQRQAPHAHWSRDLVTADVDRVLRSWLGSAIEPHAQADLDRNYLLHAMVYSGLVDTDETRALYDAIGSHAMRVPWSYTGDPAATFLYWRDQAFHADSPRR
ncbi:hypothetical protein ABIA35_002010 [Catenulispora sp. MAP12-49]|jgi:hypothetical protein|uniref:hypothetical protein n=1 Tax=unclassified Catenulispora TaxID=414885 RepID=UPI003511A422